MGKARRGQERWANPGGGRRGGQILEGEGELGKTRGAGEVGKTRGGGGGEGEVGNTRGGGGRRGGQVHKTFVKMTMENTADKNGTLSQDREQRS